MKKIITMFALLMSLSLFAMHNAYAGTQVGELATDFSLTTLDGKIFTLSGYKGKKPVYLVFWASWCPSCKAEIPAIKKIHAGFQDEMEIIAINVAVNDSLERVKRYASHFELPYAVTFDEGSKVTSQYAVQGIPTQMIIDINGIIRYRDTVGPDDVAAYLNTKKVAAR